MPLPLADRIVPSDAVVTRVVNGATVLLNTDTGRYFTLDEIGSQAWAALTSSPTVHDACDRLLAEFDVDRAELERDIEALIARLTEQGLVEVARG
jgi:hypothetical protein